MKILSAQQIKKLDAYTIENLPIASIDLMEKAALKCVYWLIKNMDTGRYVIFCGNGNNGGDGLAIARLLFGAGKDVVVLYDDKVKKSVDNELNFNRLPKQIKVLNFVDCDFEFIQKQDVIIDALLGIGLSKPIEGVYEKIINLINTLKNTVIAIDMPSGIFSESEMPRQSIFVNATHTLTFHCFKLNMLLPEYGNYFGNIHLLDIGLLSDYESLLPAKHELVTLPEVQLLYKKRKKFSHKGTYGHSLIIAGSYGKAGASVLCAKACLRSGTGLLTLFVPECNYDILQTAVPEAMIITADEQRMVSGKTNYEKYQAIAIGPGIGTEKETENTLKVLIQNATCPLVIDADALNILSMNKTWLSFLPANSILTPHPKEFERLAGKWSNDYDCMQMQIDFSVKYNCIVVFKGAHTRISVPSGKMYFNSSGNAGMATGGSGDVLTGIICALMAQQYHSFEAAVTGVYIHGLAADIAARHKGLMALTPSDIIDNLPDAFLCIEK
jgi:NAD(P)H-hydrate epimerase